MSGYCIAVAGMMGSGKSTLAKAIASHLGWTLLPEDLRSRMYLNDLFENEDRWAFDTQLSFLCEKSIRLKKYLESKNNIVLDRSIYEDVEIFAEYFFQKGKIDKRSYQTYLNLAEYFMREIPRPEFLIYCYCSRETIKDRIARRDRKYQNMYPHDHLGNIFKQYEKWIEKFDKAPVYKINSDFVDCRDLNVSVKISEDIKVVLASSKGAQYQQLLPGFSEFENFKQGYSYLEEKIPYDKENIQVQVFKKRDVQRYSYPTVYIAAPFTAVAEVDVDRHDSKYALFDFDQPHGIIMKGAYRETLNSISRFFKFSGFAVILPHRDINKWGHKTLTPEQVFHLCTRDLHSCDLFIGILGLSHGSHYEFGLMRGLNRPTIIISVDEIDDSFISQGIKTDNKNLLVLKCRRLDEVRSVLRSEETKNFLKIYFPIEEFKR